MKKLFLTLSGVVLSASAYANKPLNVQPAYSMPSIGADQPAIQVEAVELSESNSYSNRVYSQTPLHHRC
ncbi:MULTISPECIES: hypothetical protein [Acinetobacter]|uniref:hypothetical protein n=1 Tax=Acinetobacter TaxID=469 RepID=UPI00097F87DC|nr:MULTISPECIES: hypothetical protein [Acinetobacter]ONN58300.1 hypothetical protein AC057_03340 [Acinetobacter genomosp. 33YU]